MNNSTEHGTSKTVNKHQYRLGLVMVASGILLGSCTENFESFSQETITYLPKIIEKLHQIGVPEYLIVQFLIIATGATLIVTSKRKNARK